jgi:hypothetical protein
VVVEATKTERELRLEADLKAREVRISELEDERFHLKKTLETPAAPTPATPRQKKSWLAGATFFEE